MKTNTVSYSIAYAVGFLTGWQATHWWLVLVGIASYVIFDGIWRYLAKVYKINL